jgi:purine-binding chemotaxis protein CheW
MVHQDDELDIADDDTSNLEQTYLTFTLDQETYAVPVRYVTEIVRLQKTYVVPDVPAYVRGVINLRGKVIPVMDIRRRFGMPDRGYTDRTVVVVIEYNESPTGLVVDAVSEVIEIPAEQIEPPRVSAGESRASMVSGVALRAEAVLFVLDVAQLLTGSIVDTGADKLPLTEVLASNAAGRRA